MHHHKAVKSRTRERVWTHCVAGHADDRKEHGNIVREDVCRCGATRLAEVNAGTAYGPWSDEDERE